MRKLCFPMGTGYLLICLLTAGLVAAGTPKGNGYPAGAKEAYLSPEAMDFIRPGLKLTITSCTIPENLKPVVVFKLTDNQNQPLDMDGILTPGAIAPRWILSRINPTERYYTAYNLRKVTSPITNVSVYQPNLDSNGVYAKLPDGSYQYTFGVALPSSYPKNATHTLGVQASRDLTSWGLSNHVVNSTFSFVPDGSQVVNVRDVSRTEVCNRCHNPLTAHGSRRDLLYCGLCHYPNVIDPDTGNSVDLSVMVHKIHSGRDLPSVEKGTRYTIIGYQQHEYDYSEIGFPVIPGGMRNCTVCHDKGTQADNWFLEANRAACGSCHDDIDFTEGVGHFAQENDDFCTLCHQPGGDKEFDLSIKGAHVVPEKSKSLLQPKFEIVRVHNAVPGRRPEITFRLTDKDGNYIPLEDVSRLNLIVAGPTSDYAWQKRDSIDLISVGAVPDAYTRTYAYLFSEALPLESEGTYLFVLDGRISTRIDGANVNDRAETFYKYVSVDGSAIRERRKVVSDAKCNACHGNLTFHGSRRDVEYCVTCHNPGLAEEADPDIGFPGASFNFAGMIHKVHANRQLSDIYLGFHFGYPGDLRDCQQCHLADTYQLPLSEDLNYPYTPADYFTPQPAATAACLSCHDTRPAAAHAWVNLAHVYDEEGYWMGYDESCSVCHGPGRSYAVDKIHAR